MTTVSTNTTETASAIFTRQMEQFWAWQRGASQTVKQHVSTVEFRILCVMLLAILSWGVAIATFGYPALILPALALVPTIFVTLILITVGK